MTASNLIRPRPTAPDLFDHIWPRSNIPDCIQLLIFASLQVSSFSANTWGYHKLKHVASNPLGRTPSGSPLQTAQRTNTWRVAQWSSGCSRLGSSGCSCSSGPHKCLPGHTPDSFIVGSAGARVEGCHFPHLLIPRDTSRDGGFCGVIFF